MILCKQSLNSRYISLLSSLTNLLGFWIAAVAGRNENQPNQREQRDGDTSDNTGTVETA